VEEGSDSMEKSFVMVKPDGVQRELVGEIISRFENKGLQLSALKMMQISPELAASHYAEHKGKPFYNDLIEFITSGPVVAMVWQGLNAVTVIRNMMGKTNPAEASPGTIRGDFALFMGNNVVHGSDSTESAHREINLFFSPAEVVSYSKPNDTWIYGK
jgi:nucleoside-diphosphate kinase